MRYQVGLSILLSFALVLPMTQIVFGTHEEYYIGYVEGEQSEPRHFWATGEKTPVATDKHYLVHFDNKRYSLDIPVNCNTPTDNMFPVGETSFDCTANVSHADFHPCKDEPWKQCSTRSLQEISASFSVTIFTNELPVAVEDNVTMDATSNSLVIDVLANDFDPDVNSPHPTNYTPLLHILKFSEPKHGNITTGIQYFGGPPDYNHSYPGNLTYTLKDPCFFGDDEFTYTVYDGAPKTATSSTSKHDDTTTVYITIPPYFVDVDGRELPYIDCSIIWYGEGDGKNWSDPKNWSLGRIPIGTDIILIDDWIEDSSVTLDLDFTLENGGSLNISSGDELLIKKGKTLTNNAFIQNDGTLTNNGYLANKLDGTFQNSGDIISKEGSRIDTEGIFKNEVGGTITIESERLGGTVTNIGNTFTNQGTINNTGTLTNLKYGGTIDNFGTISINAGGALNNHDGAIVNHPGGMFTIDHLGTLDMIGGTMDNFGFFGSMINSGTIKGNIEVGSTKSRIVDNTCGGFISDGGIQEIPVTDLSKCLFDPNPFLIDENGNLINDVNKIDRLTERVGTTADGISQLFFVTKSKESLLISIVDGTSNDKGSLSYLSGAEGPESHTLHVTSDNDWIVAVYTPPDSFGESIPSEKRMVSLEISPITSQDRDHIVDVDIRRPPVVLIHGVWSSAQATWEDSGFKQGLENNGFTVFTADYESSNSMTFDPNASPTPAGIISLQHAIDSAVNHQRDELNVATTQVDVVGHSMGVLMTRGMTQQSFYIDRLNYNEGTIHRLISIGAPHLGSELAKVLWDNKDVEIPLITMDTIFEDFEITLIDTKLSTAMATALNMPILDGAVESLVPGSIALSNIQETNVPTHVIIGLWEPGALAPHDFLDWLIGKLIGRELFDLDATFGDVCNDTIVSCNSQLGGLTRGSQPVSEFSGLTHAPVIPIHFGVSFLDIPSETQSIQIRNEVMTLLSSSNEANFTPSLQPPSIVYDRVNFGTPTPTPKPIPETTAPETTAPETTAPETTAPETTAPETTAPETTAPETTAPETTAPETTMEPSLDTSIEKPKPETIQKYSLPKFKETKQVDVSGSITEYKRGAPVLLTITKPDGTTEEFGVMASKNGNYSLAYQLKHDMPPGEYKITVKHDEKEVESFSISIVSELIPDWIRNNAKWWSEGLIDDNSYVSGIQFLIKEKIIVISGQPETTGTSKGIPEWIKNNAGWWADGSISQDDFVNGLKFMIEKGIIRV